MLKSSRGIHRLAWVLGILLLLGSVLGASWALNQPASGTGPVSVDGNLLGVVGNGFVDVEEGLTFLHPAQPGRVEAVWVKEGDHVSEGDLLLSMDNRLAKAELDAAQAGLDAARVKLQDAEDKLTTKWESGVEEHEQALEGAKAELAAAKAKLKQQEDLHRNKSISDDILSIAKFEVQGAEAKVKGTEARLKSVKTLDPKNTIELLRQEVKAKQATRDKAHLAFVECDVYAPADGVILRLFATAGDAIGSQPQPQQRAVQLCPDAPRIVRAEILQEWANQVAVGQVAHIEDDTRAGTQWKGKVTRVSDWFAHRRAILLEPFQYNDVRTLECIIQLEPGGPPVRIGQRVRATIKQ